MWIDKPACLQDFSEVRKGTENGLVWIPYILDRYILLVVLEFWFLYLHFGEVTSGKSPPRNGA